LGRHVANSFVGQLVNLPSRNNELLEKIFFSY